MDWEVPEGLPPISCDRPRIQIVLNCLCDNAIKHTPSGGSVKLSAQFHFWDRRFAFASSPCERRQKAVPKINSVRLCVSDTGKGIPAEFHEEIFNEYFQVPGQGKPGVGLGLAIARQIVSAHEGKIWVDSHPGQGSSFHVVLPL
jgi:two-component system clock-associated histidine kinase SasA